MNIRKRYTSLGGSKREYLDTVTGSHISRRQFEKLRHGGKGIEARIKARAAAGHKRKQAPRKGVLDRVQKAIDQFLGSLREGIGKAAKDAGTSTDTIRRLAPAGSIRVEKLRGSHQFNPVQPAREFAVPDGKGGLVKVALSFSEAQRLGVARGRISRGSFPRRGYIEVVGMDGNTYRLPARRKEWNDYLKQVKDILGWKDITEDTEVSDKFYKGLVGKAA